MTTSNARQTTCKVQQQYEDFPYPYRDPNDERTRFLFTPLDDLETLNFYCFNGRRNFRPAFRALVAGGGTGDATIHLAEQFKGTGATLVHVDLSKKSIEVAMRRAQVRGLDNVTWIQGSLLDLPDSNLEPFDYINCSGVLHHLPDPEAGLHALRAMLKPGGAMGLMLYGTYGRTGIYQMQEMMRLINQGESNSSEKVANARRVLETLPETNWFKRSADMFSTADSCDIELYDLLLHSTDRPFTVSEIHAFLKNEGLQLVEFLPGMRAMYDPVMTFRDPQLLERVQQLPIEQQQAAAELYWGVIKKHDFWASTATDTVAKFEDHHNVPFFSSMASIHNVQALIRSETRNEWVFEVDCKPLKVNLALELDAVTRRFVELIDGSRTTGEIMNTLSREFAGQRTADDIWKTCRRTFESLRVYDLLLLRDLQVMPQQRAA